MKFNFFLFIFSFIIFNTIIYSYNYDSKEIEALFSDIIQTNRKNNDFTREITEEVKLFPTKKIDNSNEISKILKKAYEHLNDLDINRSKTLFQKVIASKNRKFLSSALYGLGECYFNQNNYEKAYKIWSQLSGYNDNFSKKAEYKLKYLSEILIFFKNNLYSFSEKKYLSKAASAKSDFLDNKYESSCIKCLKILNNDPKNIFAYFQLALNYRALGKYGKTIKKINYIELEKQQYEKIIKIINFPYAFNNLGIIYFEKKDYKKAIEYFKKAIKYDETGNVKELAQKNLKRTIKKMPIREINNDTYILE